VLHVEIGFHCLALFQYAHAQIIQFLQIRATMAYSADVFAVGLHTDDAMIAGAKILSDPDYIAVAVLFISLEVLIETGLIRRELFE
jgi:hypothetical protein